MAWTNAGYGGSNANANTGSFGAGTPFAGWNQAQQNYFGTGSSGGGSQYPGQRFPGTGVGAPMAGGGGGGNLSGLLQQQMGLFDKADAQNQAEWDQGSKMLTDSRDAYNNSAITQGNRNLVQGLQNDPYSINATTQANIQGNAAAGINAGNAATQKHVAGIQAANGQGDAGSMAALAERGNRQGGAQLSQTMSNLQVQKALQDKQDVQNAAHLGQQQAAQDQGVNFSTAQSFLQNMPQHKANSLAGFAAGMGGGMPAQPGFQAQGGGGFQQSGNGLNGGTFQHTNRDSGRNGGMGMAWGEAGQKSGLNGGGNDWSGAGTPAAQPGSAQSAIGAQGWGSNGKKNSIYDSQGGYNSNFYGE